MATVDLDNVATAQNYTDENCALATFFDVTLTESVRKLTASLRGATGGRNYARRSPP